ncbi:MAG: MBL fold metallo-hydrolase [Dehalococcoidia bacterium]
MKLTLLGTGTPIPDPARRGPSQVIEVGGELVLIDAGSGVLHRLLEAGYAPAGTGRLNRPIRQIGITHLHSDHITGLADLLWAGWIMRWWDQPPPIAGPPGTADFIRRLMDAFAYDIDVRQRGERLRTEWLVPRVVEIDEGWTTEGDGWRLTGFRVDHAPVDEAFGFRLDDGSHAAVISGDTRPSDNLIRHAQRTDLLVHEVYWHRGAAALLATITDPDQRARRATIDGYHTHSKEIGAIAAAAETQHLILSHILFRGGSPSDLIADIEPSYGGRLTVGADLQTFAI